MMDPVLLPGSVKYYPGVPGTNDIVGCPQNLRHVSISNVFLIRDAKDKKKKTGRNQIVWCAFIKNLKGKGKE